MILYEAFTITRASHPGFIRCFENVEISMRSGATEIFRQGPAMTGMAVARGDLQGSGASQGVDMPQAAASVAMRWAASLHAFRKPGDILPLLDGLEATPFQSLHWMTCWLEIFGADPTLECFLLTIENERNAVALALPLVRRLEGGIRIVEFLDLGVADYAAPLLRRDLLGALPESSALWSLLLPALPDADLLRFNRLCPFVEGMHNPLYAHPWARRDRISGWRLPLPETWEDYCANASAKTRDDLAKKGRRFFRNTENRIDLVKTVADGLSVLCQLERFQEERIHEKGLDYALNDPRCAAFYRLLVETGVECGQTLMAHMRSAEETIAANFAIRSGKEVIYLRVANRFGEWAKMSPGNLATDFLIREAHARGVRVFDFGMGNYEYKRRFGAIETPLMDLVLPLSVRGWPKALLWHAQYRLSRSTLLRKLTGRATLAAPCDKREA
jgi:CelD/BcsL family acetyltransferase involved in cellulose biosynthesis